MQTLRYSEATNARVPRTYLVDGPSGMGALISESLPEIASFFDHGYVALVEDPFPGVEIRRYTDKITENAIEIAGPGCGPIRRHRSSGGFVSCVPSFDSSSKTDCTICANERSRREVFSARRDARAGGIVVGGDASGRRPGASRGPRGRP